MMQEYLEVNILCICNVTDLCFNLNLFTEVIEGNDVCLNKVHNSTEHCLGKTKHIKVYAKDDVVTKNELCG